MFILKKNKIRISILTLVFLFSYSALAIDTKQGQTKKPKNKLSKILALPDPVTNNAVTLATVSKQTFLYSFNGLAQGKTYKDIHNKAYSINLASGEQKRLAFAPGSKGTLASIAVTINNRILLIGGYTVAADHSELSTPQIVEYLPSEDRYQLITKMPVPVDDTVALVYQQRYLYLISGWHDTDNVDLVQVYDLREDHWFNATPFPGAPVFGHAGGIVDSQFVITDGVKVNLVVGGNRQYEPSSENWFGKIDPLNPANIQWKKIKKHPFKPLYRMASTGIKSRNEIVFAGGSDNPYNYNGIGYNGEPSKPSSAVFSFDLANSSWTIYQELTNPSMDHRGLLNHNDELYILGGMGDKQKVLSRISHFQLNKVNKENNK